VTKTKRLSNKSENGQALIVVAIALVVLAGIIGLVVDGGNVFLDRRNAQNAADSAALASALARVKGGSNFTAAAYKAAADNGYANDGTTNTVTVNIPPATGPHTGDPEYIQVVIVSHVKTYIAAIFGWSNITNTSEAVARSKPSEMRQLLGGTALVSLAPESNCGSKKAFLVRGDINVEISGGGVFVNSNNKTCALTQEGNGKINIAGGYKINVVGGASVQKAQFLTPSVVVGNIPISYPPPFFMPEVLCGEQEAVVSDDGTSISSGLWSDGDFPPEGVTNLGEGLFCIEDGDFVVQPGTSLTGKNVTIFVQSGEVNLSGDANISLEAPIAGDYYGLLIFLPMENTNGVNLSGSNDSLYKGTILAPGSKIIITGTSPKVDYHSQILGYIIEIKGSHKINIIYKSSENFHSFSMPEVQLSQ